MQTPSALLRELEQVCLAAGEIARQERRTIRTEIKVDGTVVTNADRSVETFLRAELERIVPGAGLWGEEFGHAPPTGAGQWVIDPIDGTSNFSFGSPLWGVTAALVVDGELELGAIVLPDLGESYIAERGRGAWSGGEALPPIPPAPILPTELVSYDDGLVHRFPNSELPGKMRYSGAFVIDGAFVARQRLRGMIGRREKLYDIAATVLLNQELGAEIRYADGTPFSIRDLTDGRKITEPWIIFPRGTGYRL